MRPLLLLALLLAATPAWAHKLKLFAAVEGADIVGEAYFAGGDKAINVPGRLLGSDGGPAVAFVTGPDGAFRLTVTRRTDYTVLVESADGHAATAAIRAEDLPASLAASASPAESVALEAAVARQIRPLREQLAAYEDRLRLHDLLGGIGTIFGLFGCYAWVQARRTGS